MSIEGYIYIIYNRTYDIYGDNIYKLGKTKDIKKRLNGYLTSYLDKVEVKYLSKKCIDYSLAEKELFKRLRDYRINTRKEFFRIEMNIIIQEIDNIIENINTNIIEDVEIENVEIDINIEYDKLKKNLGLDILNPEIIKKFYKKEEIIYNFLNLLDIRNIKKSEDISKHIEIKNFIKALGYKNIFNNNLIPTEILKENINRTKEEYNSLYINKKKDTFKADLGHINTILKKYGLNIKLEQKSKKINKKIIKINFYKMSIIDNIHELIYYRRLKGYEFYDEENIFKIPNILIYNDLVI